MVRRPHRDFERYRVSIFARDFAWRLKGYLRKEKHPVLMLGVSFLAADHLPVSAHNKLYVYREISEILGIAQRALSSAADPEAMTVPIAWTFDPEAFTEKLTWDFIGALQRANFSLSPSGVQSFENSVRSFSSGLFNLSLDAANPGLQATGFSAGAEAVMGDLFSMLVGMLKQEEEEVKAEVEQHIEEELQRYVSPPGPEPKPHAR